jgi:hypothetical protein
MALRHFLQQSEAPLPTDDQTPHWLLVMDHHQARIFRSNIPGVAPQRILPNEPEGHLHTLHDSAEVARGKEEPDANSFFVPVAHSLQKAAQILIFGTGTGTSSEMVQFFNWLKVHHADLAARVSGCVTVDEHHLTNDQLLTKAREFYSKAALAETQTA